MKITGGKYNSLTIKTADYANIKPTLSKIRESVFNTLASSGEYKNFCDLFAGSGIMSFEALSRGYDVYSIEIDRKSVKIIEENIARLKTSLNLFNADALKFLKTTELKFDIFYIDPPYNSDLYEKTLKIISERNLLMPNGVIILEKPASKKIYTERFRLIKEKIYGDKTICYIGK